MSRAYTLNELQKIVDETWNRAWQVFKVLHRDAPMPKAPNALEVVDHPFHGSDAPGQYKKPWLNDTRGKRGDVPQADVSEEGQ